MKRDSAAKVDVELLAIIGPPPAFGKSWNRSSVDTQLRQTLDAERGRGLSNAEIRSLYESLGIAND
jgi:hypothetical protein